MLSRGYRRSLFLRVPVPFSAATPAVSWLICNSINPSRTASGAREPSRYRTHASITLPRVTPTEVKIPTTVHEIRFPRLILPINSPRTALSPLRHSHRTDRRHRRATPMPPYSGSRSLARAKETPLQANGTLLPASAAMRVLTLCVATARPHLRLAAVVETRRRAISRRQNY